VETEPYIEYVLQTLHIFTAEGKTRFENNSNMHSTQFNLRLSVCIFMEFQAVEYLRKVKNYVFIRSICNDVTPLSCSDNVSRYDEASLLAVLDRH